MEITDVQVKLVEDDLKLKAWASITLDDVFVVHNLKVINGQNGMFVAMPSRLTKSGEFKDVAHPIAREFREALEKKVLSAYQEVLGRPQRSVEREENTHQMADDRREMTEDR